MLRSFFICLLNPIRVSSYSTPKLSVSLLPGLSKLFRPIYEKIRSIPNNSSLLKLLNFSWLKRKAYSFEQKTLSKTRIQCKKCIYKSLDTFYVTFSATFQQVFFGQHYFLAATFLKVIFDHLATPTFFTVKSPLFQASVLLSAPHQQFVHLCE